MTFAEARKAVVPLLVGVVGILTQFAPFLPETSPATKWVTGAIAVISAVLVYAAPNKQKSVMEKAQDAFRTLDPVIDIVREQVAAEVDKRLPSGAHALPDVGAVAAQVRQELDRYTVPSRSTDAIRLR